MSLKTTRNSRVCVVSNDLFHLDILPKLEDTKGVIRRGKSKDRQYNGQKKKDKQCTKQCAKN